MSRTSGLLKNNPIIALGLTLPFVIVPTLSLKGGLMMSAFLAAATIPSATLAPLLGKKLAPLLALPCYGVISMTFVLLLRYFLAGQAALLDGLGVYLPIAAMNGMMLDLALLHPRKRVGTALRDSVMMCLGFTLVACFVAVLREFFGSGSLWGIPVAVPIRVRGLALPFAGFILIGFLSALFRRLDNIIIGRMLHSTGRPSGEAGDPQ